MFGVVEMKKINKESEGIPTDTPSVIIGQSK